MAQCCICGKALPNKYAVAGRCEDAACDRPFCQALRQNKASIVSELATNSLAYALSVMPKGGLRHDFSGLVVRSGCYPPNTT